MVAISAGWRLFPADSGRSGRGSGQKPHQNGAPWLVAVHQRPRRCAARGNAEAPRVSWPPQGRARPGPGPAQCGPAWPASPASARPKRLHHAAQGLQTVGRRRRPQRRQKCLLRGGQTAAHATCSAATISPRAVAASCSSTDRSGTSVSHSTRTGTGPKHCRAWASSCQTS